MIRFKDFIDMLDSENIYYIVVKDFNSDDTPVLWLDIDKAKSYKCEYANRYIKNFEVDPILIGNTIKMNITVELIGEEI